VFWNTRGEGCIYTWGQKWPLILFPPSSFPERKTLECVNEPPRLYKKIKGNLMPLVERGRGDMGFKGHPTQNFPRGGGRNVV